MSLEIKVTRISNRWHARLLENAKVVDEMACNYRVDIGYICATMMRWYDKCIGTSKYARSSRERFNRKNPGVKGKIWYQNQLHKTS